MSDPSSEYLAAIARHSAGLADAADGNLAAAVEHCPGWTVADLVNHVTEVQWFWATIVERAADRAARGSAPAGPRGARAADPVAPLRVRAVGPRARRGAPG